jgi:Zn-dependent peptidase ImmA (M78 family)/transcriptional regulator with XRE-family HTH domain
MDNNVNPEMLTLARESRGMSQAELAQAIGSSQGKISKYESGMLTVTDSDLDTIAGILEYTKEFFYQSDKVYGLGCSFIFNRKRKKVPVSTQKKLQADVNILRMRIDRLLRDFDIEHENTFKPLDVDEYDGRPERVAATVRSQWNVPQGPIGNVTALIESAGGIVVKMPFPTRLIDAVHLWPPGLPPLFFINQNLSGDRLRWTLVHEIGHAIMHDNPTADDVEEQANQFAGEFLMPREEIKGFLHGLTLERAATLKPYWKASMSAIIRRAWNLGCISERKYRSLNAGLSAQGYKTNEPFPVEVEEPKLLGQIYSAHLTELGYEQVELELALFTPKPASQQILSFRESVVMPFYTPERIAR